MDSIMDRIMAKLYFNLIQKGEKTIDGVPLRLRAAVQALIEGSTSV